MRFALLLFELPNVPKISADFISTQLNLVVDNFAENVLFELSYIAI